MPFRLILYGNGSEVFKTEFWAVFYSDNAPFGGLALCRKAAKSLCSLDAAGFAFCEQSFLVAALKVALAAVRMRKEPKPDAETALLQKALAVELDESKNAMNADFSEELRVLMLSFGEKAARSCLAGEERAALVLLALNFGACFGEHAKSEIVSAVLEGGYDSVGEVFY